MEQNDQSDEHHGSLRNHHQALRGFADSLVRIQISIAQPRDRRREWGWVSGIPLKIVQSDLRLILIEPSQKKCSFLHSIIGGLKLEQVSIYPGELKQYAAQEPYDLADVILLRALRFEEIAEPAASILKPTGHLLLFRTERVNEGPSQAFRVESNHDFVLPMNHGSRVVTVLAKAPSV